MQVDLKKLKPIGVVLVLGFGILFVILCMTANLGVPEKYTPEHELSWYAEGEENLKALAVELENNVLPGLEGAVDCAAEPASGRVLVHTEKGFGDKVRTVLERDFGKELITVSELP